MSKSKKPVVEVTLKDQGNKAFADRNYELAAQLFTRAIEADPDNAILYSNRSAAYAAAQSFDNALRDATRAVDLKPEWSKAWLRKGQALEGLMLLQQAMECYEEAASRDPADATIQRARAELNATMEEIDQTMTQSNSQSDNPEIDRFDAQVNWLKEGQANFPYLMLKYYDEDYRGVHALTKIPSNRVILEVPLSHIMTSEVAKASPIGQKIIKSGCELNSSHSYIASYLLQEKNNPNSFWAPYLRILPQNYRNMPIFFTPAELSLLKGSFSIRKIIDRQEELKDEFENICRHVPEYRKYGLDDFIWARLVVITRIFGLVVNGVKTDGLVPMADMLNHRRPRETAWTFDDARQAFTITSLKAINRGDQIYDSYGRKCNSRFFVNYGFSLEDNEDNQIAIWVHLPSDDSHYSMKCRYMGGQKQGSQLQRYQISIDYREKATKEALSFLRFVYAKDGEFMLLSADSKEVNIKNVNPISMRNEMNVIRHMARECEACLSEFDTSVEQDNKLLATSSITMNERNAILMRKGEKEVALHYIALEREMEKLSKMPWKEVKRTAAKTYNGKGRFDGYINNVIVPLLRASAQ